MLSATKKLTGDKYGEFKQALLDAYSRDELREMVRIQLGRDFDIMVSDTTFEVQVAMLMRWFERRGLISDLIRGAMRGNPTNPMLLEFNLKYPELTASPVMAEHGDTKSERTTIDIVISGDHLSEQQLDLIVRMLCAAVSVPHGDIKVTQVTPTNSTRLTVELSPSEVLTIYSVLKSDRLEAIEVKSVSLANANLSGVDLAAALLSKANLVRSTLVGTRLERTDLRGADLEDANLEYADLWDANLRGANLRGADLRYASLDWANLEGANLRGANLEGAVLTRARYNTGTHWPEKIDFRQIGAVGPGAKLRGAILDVTHLADADLHGADLHWADLRQADLRKANLQDADLRWADLRRTDMSGANLQGADLRQADLRGADMSGANLHGADLGGAMLDGFTRWTMGRGYTSKPEAESPEVSE